MKVKLSHKDLILLIGIVVAIVIAFTTWVYNDMKSNASLSKPEEKKSGLIVPAPSTFMDKLIKKTTSSALSTLR